MPLSNLRDVLQPAMTSKQAVMGAVVLGWEDAEAYVDAAQEVGCPVILQAGPKLRETMPIVVIGAMFRQLALAARVPVVAHVDHARSVDECLAGIDAGFTSVMYDGSALPIDENIANSRSVVEAAHRSDVSVETEAGFVGYDGGAASQMTDVSEAERLAGESGCDALAVSVGNVHLQREAQAVIDLEHVRVLEDATGCPLVIHGASGVPGDMRRRLALETRVCKFNVGTEFRQLFGATLREVLARNPDIFDRGEILRAVKPAIREQAVEVMRSFRE